MAIGKTNAGGGGTSLNFDVKRYSTEAELLAATPKKYTIGIITTTPIGRWSFIGTSVVDDAWGSEGDLYIYSGTDNNATSAFNALKKNEIILSPMSAKQKVGGTYVGVPAKIYNGAEWVSLEKYIVQNGESDLFNSALRAGFNNIVKQDGYIRVYSDGMYTCGCATSEKIDITDFSNLTMRCNVIEMSTYISLGIATAINNSSEAAVNSSIVAETSTTETGEQTITVNISKYSGEYYPCVKIDCGNAADGDGDVYVYDMYFS